MKVIDAFMFSEPYETELLLLKLEMGNAVIDEWVIAEGAYTFQGEYKGHHLRAILEGDARFAPYRPRVTLLEIDENFNRSYLMSPLEYLRRYLKTRIPRLGAPLVALSEEAAFFAERSQREVPIRHILSKYDDEDFVILTDVDEMLDAANPRKRDVFLNALRSHASGLRLRIKEFLYDFDNMSCRKRFIAIVNVASIRRLKTKSGVAQHVKHRLRATLPDATVAEDLMYEFSYCFDRSSIMRKTRSFAHTGKSEAQFERALLCNHFNRDLTKIDAAFLANPESWFERVAVNEHNLPDTVVRRFDQIRTGCVAANYVEMRRKFYPERFSTIPRVSGAA